VTLGGTVATLARGMDYHHRLAELRSGGAAPVYYAYDSESRLSTVSTPAFEAEYAYTLDGWDAGYSVALANGVVLDRIVARDPCRRSLVKAITNSVNGLPYNPLDYNYDKLSRVTSRNTDTFDYNARSEVISANIGSTASRYAYDNIGNNIWVSVNTVTNFYSANDLNQYTRISNGSVTEPEYDLDGNMTWDGRLSYIWDAENRLIAAYSNNICVVSNAYDHLSRRVLKVSHGGTETRRFVYDGWNLVQETISAASGTTTNHYVWGKDISGTLQGAGGVGGLLAVSLNGAWYFPFYDNNGNVLAYADETGTIVAEYLYDAFGRTIAAMGLLADTFRHRFSTKYYDTETGFYYYGYRFYAPELMRWLNRDPIDDPAFVAMHFEELILHGNLVLAPQGNLYLHVNNHALGLVDILGLAHINNYSGKPLLILANIYITKECRDWLKKEKGLTLKDGINGVPFVLANGVSTKYLTVITDVDAFWSTHAPGTGGTARKISIGTKTITASNMGSAGSDVTSFSAKFLGGAPLSIWVNTTLDKTYRSYIDEGVKKCKCDKQDLTNLDKAVIWGQSAISSFPAGK
jgi:RHS repeat-associated protein